MKNLKIIASSANWIDSRSVEALKKIGTFESVISVVGMPDLGVGDVPNGMAMVTKDKIFPHLIGSDIGCGMSLSEVKINAKKIKVEKFAKILSNIDLRDEPQMAYNFGTIGKGNHFIELHQVKEIFDEELFSKLEMDKKSLFLLAHSGSRAFGQEVFDSVSGRYEPHLGLDKNSIVAKQYLAKHDEAVTFAKNSRLAITQKFLQTLGLNNEIKVISDTAHNSITKIDDGYLHRKGSSPMECGVVIIAGSRGSLSYLVTPKKVDFDISNGSLAHGAGRKWERRSAKAKLENRYTKTDLLTTKIGSKVVCADTKLLYEEAPEVYKNIEIVIKDLVDAGLVDVVASFKPLLTYKEA